MKVQLWKATPKQRVALLAPAGFWYDALAASAESRRTDPTDTDWTELLRAVGLEEIATRPMLRIFELQPEGHLVSLRRQDACGSSKPLSSQNNGAVLAEVKSFLLEQSSHRQNS